MKKTVEGVEFTRNRIAKSWMGEINGQRIVVENTGRFRERWVIHPWPKMVKYPPLLAKAETMSSAVRLLMSKAESR